ncbi:MAG: hypothetical protein KF711_03970 [Nitrospira sp.]|nr:hypothetical protein [Nitrospira sp.]
MGTAHGRSGLSTGDKVSLGRDAVVDRAHQVCFMMLTQAGYDVEEAEDGGRAVEEC